MRRILTLLTIGLLALTACSGSAVLEQVATAGDGADQGATALAGDGADQGATALAGDGADQGATALAGDGADQGAAITSSGGSESAAGDVTPAEPAESETAESAVGPAALALEEPESAEQVAAVAVDITQEVWCAGLGPGIRQAHQETIDVRYLDPAGLADAVEELHRFYRVAATGRPLAIATDVAAINHALDELEPVLRPVGWDYSLIDRSTIADADGAYKVAGMAINRYNIDVCGLEPPGHPEDPEIEIAEPVLQEAPQLANPDASLTDFDIAFMIEQAEASGMTTEEATCFVELFVSRDKDEDLTQIVLELFECGLDPDRLEELGVFGDDGIQITSPDNRRTEEEIEAMIRSAERNGMTRTEAECHVGAYLDVVERGGETGAALDKLLACGLTVERMEELGIFAGCPWRPGLCARND